MIWYVGSKVILWLSAWLRNVDGFGSDSPETWDGRDHLQVQSLREGEILAEDVSAWVCHVTA